MLQLPSDGYLFSSTNMTVIAVATMSAATMVSAMMPSLSSPSSMVRTNETGTKAGLGRFGSDEQHHESSVLRLPRW